MQAQAGSGTCGEDKFYRLHYNVCTNIYADSDTVGVEDEIHSRIPVLIERPGKYEKPGGWVSYLNGQTAWVDYPGEFPMTKRFIEALEALETEFQALAKEAEGI